MFYFLSDCSYVTAILMRIFMVRIPLMIILIGVPLRTIIDIL